MDKWISEKVIRVHLRVTGKTSKEVQVLLEKHNVPSYIIGQELGHCHSLISGIDLGTNYNNLRNWLKKELGLNGNKDYSISRVRNLRDCAKYIIKEDLEYIVKRFDKEWLSDLKLTTFNKDKKELMLEIDELAIKYIKDTRYSADKDFGEKFILLKVKYNQNLYMSHIKAYLLKMRIKKDPKRVGEIYDLMFSAF